LLSVFLGLDDSIQCSIGTGTVQYSIFDYLLVCLHVETLSVCLSRMNSQGWIEWRDSYTRNWVPFLREDKKKLVVLFLIRLGGELGRLGLARLGRAIGPSDSTLLGRGPSLWLEKDSTVLASRLG